MVYRIRSVVTKTWLSKFSERVCWKCGEKFQIGDKIITRGSGRTRKWRKFMTGRKTYHLECWESMFHDVDLTEKDLREIKLIQISETKQYPR